MTQYQVIYRNQYGANQTIYFDASSLGDALRRAADPRLAGEGWLAVEISIAEQGVEPDPIAVGSDAWADALIARAIEEEGT